MLRRQARCVAAILCFALLFRQLTWRHAQALLIGAILDPGLALPRLDGHL